MPNRELLACQITAALILFGLLVVDATTTVYGGGVGILTFYGAGAVALALIGVLGWMGINALMGWIEVRS